MTQQSHDSPTAVALVVLVTVTQEWVAYPLGADQRSHNAHVGCQKQLQPHN